MSTLAASLPADSAALSGLFQTLAATSLVGVGLFRPVYAADDSSSIVDFDHLYLNPAAQRMLGLPECPPESFLTLYKHALQTGSFDFYRDAFLSTEPHRREFNYQHDGLDNYYHLVAQRSGEVLVVNFTDTADQDRSAVEQALRESQAREQAARAAAERERNLLRTLLAQAPVAIGLFQGEEEVVTMANDRMCAMWGRPASEIIGKPWLEAVPELVGQGFFELVAEVGRTRQPFIGQEYPADVLQNGQVETHYFNFVYQALYDQTGGLLGVIDIAVDVTEQVHARQQVQKLNAQLADANARLLESNNDLLANSEELLLVQQQMERLSAGRASQPSAS